MKQAAVSVLDEVHSLHRLTYLQVLIDSAKEYNYVAFCPIYQFWLVLTN